MLGMLPTKGIDSFLERVVKELVWAREMAQSVKCLPVCRKT